MTRMPMQAKTSLSDPLSSSSYVPLLQNDDDFDTVVESKLPILPSSQRKCDHHRVYALYIVIGVLLVFNILLLGVVISLRSTSHPNPQIIFSPATDAIEYEVVKFHAGPLNNEENDIYSSPPSPEVDQAWRNLYEIGAVRLPQGVGSKLVNATTKTNDDGSVVVGIDVFHQLHCLNKIRKALHPEYHTATSAVYDMHITHCVNSIRQSLQCSSDISTIPFNLQSINGFNQEPMILPSFDILHSCRNFGKIKEWVKERWAREYLDNE